MQVAFYTLGCKVNQNETDAMKKMFCDAGFSLAESEDYADIFVVNSCTVTAGGDKKSRQWLRHAKRINPDAVTVLTGCYPQAFPEEAAAATEADVITGSHARTRLPEDVLQFVQTRRRIIDIVPHQKGDVFEELPLQLAQGHTRAFVKIQDGCNRRCAYCVIPRARGLVRSRGEESIVKELTALAKEGFSEVVFTGINLPSYGQDTGTDLGELSMHISDIPGLERIRFGSLEPDLMSDDMIARMAKTPKICPQFHLSLQSGCDKTLRDMRRVYTTAQYTEVVNKLRAAIPHATFTTDIIVGFPGETDEDFETTMRYVTEIGFLKVHVFSYSRREGTPAADFPNQIPENIKADRSHRLQAHADAVRAEAIKAMQGQPAEVLLEKPVSANLFTGYTKEYVPVLVVAGGHKQGEIVPVTLGEFDGERCRAELMK